jgi:hypothetical protein
MTKAAKVGTHLPVLKSLCDLFGPKTALELGTGNVSTTYLSDKVERLICVENDPLWFAQLRHRLRKNRNVEFLLHYVGDKKHSVSADKYTTDEIEVSKELYNSLAKKTKDFDLLFVDHYLALRVMSLKKLYQNFRLVAWHDEQSLAYGYDEFFKEPLDNYHRYYFCFWGCATGFLIRKDQEFSEKELFASLDKYSLQYLEGYKGEMHKHSVPKWITKKMS